MAQSDAIKDMKMDPASLYREEIFTDQRMGTLRRLSPVNREGEPDTSRTVRYMGEAQIMTPMGALPIGFEIEANNLGEAAEKFADGAKGAIERTMRELQEMRREQASSIVVPGAGMGGKIQMP